MLVLVSAVSLLRSGTQRGHTQEHGECGYQSQSRTQPVENRCCRSRHHFLLDIAFLTADAQPHDGEVRTLALGIDGHDVLVVVCADLELNRLAAVVIVALELAADDITLLTSNYGDVVVCLGVAA